MKVIIAGSRHLTHAALVEKAIRLAKAEIPDLEITEVVSGAAQGIDTLGEKWAQKNLGPGKIRRFPADWNNVNVPNARIKVNKFGQKYNANAGFSRNQLMANYADALIAVTTGTPGTGDMISRMKALGKPVFVYWIEHY